MKEKNIIYSEMIDKCKSAAIESRRTITSFSYIRYNS